MFADCSDLSIEVKNDLAIDAIVFYNRWWPSLAMYITYFIFSPMHGHCNLLYAHYFYTLNSPSDHLRSNFVHAFFAVARNLKLLLAQPKIGVCGIQ